jgi:hypothetical protein
MYSVCCPAHPGAAQVYPAVSMSCSAYAPACTTTVRVRAADRLTRVTVVASSHITGSWVRRPAAQANLDARA